MPENTDDRLGMAPEDYADIQRRLGRVVSGHDRRTTRRNRLERAVGRRKAALAGLLLAATSLIGGSAAVVAAVTDGDGGPPAAATGDLWDRVAAEVALPVSAESDLWVTADDLGHPLGLVTLPCGGSARVSFRTNPQGGLEFRSEETPGRWYLATTAELTDRLCAD